MADQHDFLRLTGLSGVYIADAPTSRLTDDIYGLLEPYAEVDADNGYALRSLVEAGAKMFVDIDEIVRDSETGEPGWSAIFDATRTPPEGLGWLGQIVGVQLNPGDTIADSRARVDDADGIHRGNPDQLIAAVKRTLTGNKTVILVEMTSSAWDFAVRTRTTETPDALATLAAAKSQKPAGLIMDCAVFAGLLYLETSAAFATYSATTAAKATYALRSLP